MSFHSGDSSRKCYKLILHVREHWKNLKIEAFPLQRSLRVFIFVETVNNNCFYYLLAVESRNFTTTLHFIRALCLSNRPPSYVEQNRVLRYLHTFRKFYFQNAKQFSPKKKKKIDHFLTAWNPCAKSFFLNFFLQSFTPSSTLKVRNPFCR